MERYRYRFKSIVKEGRRGGEETQKRARQVPSATGCTHHQFGEKE
jgi:hypothetical protein